MRVSIKKSFITIQLLLFVLLMTPVFIAQAIASGAVAGKPNSYAAPYAKRVVSLGPTNTENLYLLGASDRLVGNTIYCTHPEEARTLTKVGTIMEVSIEKVLSLKPDLVLATGMTPASFVRKMEALHVAVERFEQPKSFEESCAQFIRLGELLGLKEKATAIIAEVKGGAAKVQQSVQGLQVQKVFFQIGSQPLYGAVPGMFTHDFIAMAGGDNIIGDQSLGRSDYEKVIVQNPDVIVIAMMGSETGIAFEEKKKWMNYPIINAVRNDRIHIVAPDIACSPSPATFVETLRLIAGYIHPEASASN